MTNTLELDIAIKRARLTRIEVAQYLGISLMAFFNKLHNKTEFRASEIVKIARLLKLSDKQRDIIFFAYKVD